MQTTTVYKEGKPGSFGGVIFAKYNDDWCVANVFPQNLRYLNLTQKITEDEPIKAEPIAPEVKVVEPVEVVPEVKVKPKRKRRTKKEMAAAKDALAADLVQPEEPKVEITSTDPNVPDVSDIFG